MIAAIEASKRQPFGACCSRSASRTWASVTAQALADEFGSIDALMRGRPEKIAAVEGMGPVIAERWRAGSSTEHAEVVDGLRAAGVRMSGPSARAAHPTARWPARRWS